MFSTGQLIRSARTDRLFIVDIWPFAYPLRNGHINPNPLRIAHGQWKLVGNNYQPKGINKALREVRAS